MTVIISETKQNKTQDNYPVIPSKEHHLLFISFLSRGWGKGGGYFSSLKIEKKEGERGRENIEEEGRGREYRRGKEGDGEMRDSVPLKGFLSSSIIAHWRGSKRKRKGVGR